MKKIGLFLSILVSILFVSCAPKYYSIKEINESIASGMSAKDLDSQYKIEYLFGKDKISNVFPEQYKLVSYNLINNEVNLKKLFFYMFNDRGFGLWGTNWLTYTIKNEDAIYVKNDDIIYYIKEPSKMKENIVESVSSEAVVVVKPYDDEDEDNEDEGKENKNEDKVLELGVVKNDLKLYINKIYLTNIPASAWNEYHDKHIMSIVYNYMQKGKVIKSLDIMNKMSKKNKYYTKLEKLYNVISNDYNYINYKDIENPYGLKTNGIYCIIGYYAHSYGGGSINKNVCIFQWLSDKEFLGKAGDDIFFCNLGTISASKLKDNLSDLFLRYDGVYEYDSLAGKKIVPKFTAVYLWGK